jgi:hypothetical protein
MCSPVTHSLSLLRPSTTPQAPAAPKWLEKTVRWLRANQNRSMVERLAVRCLTVVATIFLCLTGIGILLVYPAAKEWKRQAREEVKPVPSPTPNSPLQEKIKKKLEEKPLKKIKEFIGNKTYEGLPILEIQNSNRLYYLSNSDLSAPAMRGIDSDDRPFIALKAKNKVTGEQFLEVVTHQDDEIRCIVAGHDCRHGMFDDLPFGFFGADRFRVGLDICIGNVQLCKDRQVLQRLARVLNGTDDKFVLLAS